MKEDINKHLASVGLAYHKLKITMNKYDLKLTFSALFSYVQVEQGQEDTQTLKHYLQFKGAQDPKPPLIPG